MQQYQRGQRRRSMQFVYDQFYYAHCVCNYYSRPRTRVGGHRLIDQAISYEHRTLSCKHDKNVKTFVPVVRGTLSLTLGGKDDTNKLIKSLKLLIAR